MKLYLKKLRNAEELEREKRLLIKEKKRLENEDFFPGISISGIVKNTDATSSQKSASSQRPAADTLTSGVMSMAAPLAGLLFDIVQQRIMGIGKSEGNESVGNSIINKSLKRGGNMLGTAAREV
ncbi:MAG: hypothetical protein K9G49_06275, partial [Taibaiella sp.]|nr:hypothetical protein [Taibaiella sp.]